MCILALLVCMVLLMLSFRKSENFYNPTVVYFVLWSCILVFNLLGAYNIKKAQDITYIYVIISLIALFFGNVLGQNSQDVRLAFANKYIGKNHNGKLRYSVIYTLMVLSTIFLILDIQVVVRALLNKNTLTVIRTWYTSTYSTGNNPIEARRGFVEQVIRVVLIEPFFVSLPILCTINLFGDKRNKLFLLSSIGLLILNVLASGGGRLAVLTYALTFIMGFFIYRRDKKISAAKIIKYKKWIISFSVLGVIAVVFLTIKRSSTSVVEEVYYYFSMCIPLLDRWVPVIQSSPRTFGFLSFFGIFRIPFLVLEKIGSNSIEIYSNARNYILQANYFYNVGARFGNSFVSPIYYLYLDGGILGIIIGMFFFGYFGSKTYKKVRLRLEKRRIYFLLLFIQAAFMSFIRWQFIGTAFSLAYLYAVIFFKEEAGNEK